MTHVTNRSKLIAKNLRRFCEARKAVGISQRAQAAEIGWTPGTLNQYLLGNCGINYDALFTMCEYYGVSPFAVDPYLWDRVMKY